MSARQCLLGRMLANARPCVAHTPVTRRPPQCWHHTASARQPNPVVTAATTRRHTLGGLLGGVLLLDAAGMRGGRSVASAAAVSDVEKVRGSWAAYAMCSMQSTCRPVCAPCLLHCIGCHQWFHCTSCSCSWQQSAVGGHPRCCYLINSSLLCFWACHVTGQQQ